jgi:hypothetical protein
MALTRGGCGWWSPAMARSLPSLAPLLAPRRVVTSGGGDRVCSLGGFRRPDGRRAAGRA